ncbi:hypothetical protein [Kitasatospora mediocidica]|nr:hypothetical protein [Kitasatospora mediocidica]
MAEAISLNGAELLGEFAGARPAAGIGSERSFENFPKVGPQLWIQA